jgi:TolB protein
MSLARRAVAILGVALAGVGTIAQQQPLTGKIEGQGYSRVKIAVPDADTDEVSRSAAREIVDVVRADLAFSGYFDVVDPALYAQIPPSAADLVRFDDWRSLGADALVMPRVRKSGDRIDLQGRLFDTASKTTLFARRYGGAGDLVRRVAHQLADDLVKQYTGRSGVALTRIAFVSKHEKGNELYLMDYDGSRVRRLTTTGTLNLSPAWSPDGERLAFVSWRSGRPAVYLMGSDGKLVRATTAGGELDAFPDWSPDAKKLVYTSDAGGNSELYLLDLTTGRNTRLTSSPAIDTSPAFSPNGREIAFTSDRSGGPQVYLMDVDGLNVRRVTRDGSYNDSPAWSPKGDRLAYVTRTEGKFDILSMDVESGAVTRLTHGEGSNENPRFSPEGRHIVFASNRAGTYDVYTMAADGSNVRRLTQGGDCYTPDWSH